MPYLGKRISHLRKFKKMTQRSFAAKAEINYRHYQDIEGDKADIRVSTATEIANILEVPVQMLFDKQLNLDLIKSGLSTSWEILDKLPTGICIINLEGKVLYLNSYFKKALTNLSEKELLEDVFVWNFLPQDKIQAGKNRFLSILREQPVPKAGYQVYLGPKQIELQVKIVWNYLRDADGKIKGFISSVFLA